MKKGLDIYNYEQRIQGCLIRLKKSKLSEIDKKLILKFRDHLATINVGVPRQIKYLDHLKTLCQMLKVDLNKATESDLKGLVRRIQEMDYSAWTKQNLKVVIKRFYKWFDGGDKKYPEKVEWIKANLRRTEHQLPDEGDLLTEDEHTELKVISSKSEHGIITTNADEVLEKENKPTERSVVQQPIKKVDIDLELDRRLFRHSELSFDEIKYLQHKGFRETTQKSIVTGKRERFLVKPRFNESVQHFFLTMDIANYLRRYTNKIWLFETKKPDIVFEANGKKIAIEVETGKVLKGDKEQIHIKVAFLNKVYDDWFFVAVDPNDASEYRSFGKVVDKRYLRNQLEKYIRNLEDSQNTLSGITVS